MKMLHCVADTVCEDIIGSIGAEGKNRGNRVTHGNAVGNIGEHGKIIGTVAKSKAILQRFAPSIQEPLDSSSLGMAFLDHFINIVKMMDDIKIFPAEGKKTLSFGRTGQVNKYFIKGIGR